MSYNRVTPGWGKAIGILMIIFGSLGVFIQFYKMIIPQIFKAQGGMMQVLNSLPPPENQPDFRATQAAVGELMIMSNFQANVLLFGGIIGLIACAVYIVAGAKLLKALPANYNLAKNMLFALLAINLLTAILLLMDGFSFIVMAIMFYIVLGFIIDLVLVIILLASDKRRYGIGEDPNQAVYSVDQNNPEVL